MNDGFYVAYKSREDKTVLNYVTCSDAKQAYEVACFLQKQKDSWNVHTQRVRPAANGYFQTEREESYDSFKKTMC